VRQHEQREQILLGWIGSASTAPSLAQLVEPIAALARAIGDREVGVLAVGGRAPEIPGVRVRSEPWSEEREERFLAEVDIGLMPLPDNEWTRGKCAYKALQYMAAGIPVVADPVGVSAEVIGHEHGGLIAGSASDWTDSLASLARDAGTRSRLGRQGRERVAESFSVEAWAPTLAEILHGSR